MQYKQGTDYFRHNGAGEMLVFSAADFEDFRVERPDMPPEMEGELEEVVRVLAQNRWPWRLHATYDETIARALDVFEKVHRDTPLTGLNWFFDHAETISDKSIDRIAALGGGIAVQHRMAYQGEYFIERYGAAAAEATPPVAKMLARGVKVSAGTDATRVASYNPWVSLSWMVTGKTVGGTRLYPARNCLDRETALRMWTENVAWFSNEEGKRGRIEPGQLADFIVPDKDYFSCAEDEISFLTSDLTVVGGRVVYGAGEFGPLDDNPLPPAMPDWSPTRLFGGYAAWGDPDGAGRNSLGYRNMAACGCAAPAACMGMSMRAPGRRRPARICRAFWRAGLLLLGRLRGVAMNATSAWERRLAGAARPLFGSAVIRFLAYLAVCRLSAGRPGEAHGFSRRVARDGAFRPVAGAGVCRAGDRARADRVRHDPDGPAALARRGGAGHLHARGDRHGAAFLGAACRAGTLHGRQCLLRTSGTHGRPAAGSLADLREPEGAATASA